MARYHRENIMAALQTAIQERFAADGIKVLAIKLTIIPVYPAGLAQLNYSYVAKPAYMGLVA